MIVQTLIAASAEPTHLTTAQVWVRGLVVFGVAMPMVRLAARRFRLAGRIPFRYRRLGDLLRGRPVVLAEVGDWEAEALKKTHFCEPGLHQTLRFEGGVADLNDARLVTLERSGHINVVPRR